MKKTASALIALVSSAALAAPALAQPLDHVNVQLPEEAPISLPQLRSQISGSSTGAVPVQHPGAPVPVPFTPDYLAGFISDISSYNHGIYAQVNGLFPHVRDNEPEAMAANLETVVRINNTATPEQIRQAQVDAVVSEGGLVSALSFALGEEFGAALRASLAEGRLPKTSYLLDNGYLSRAGGLASSTLIEKQIFNFPRPHVVAPERIKRYNTPETGDLYLSSNSFPSGHTNQAAWVSALLAYMVPELAPQLLYRGASSGHSRIVLGVHYPLDVIGGRMSGYAAAADRLNDPKMRDALNQAAAELRAEIEWRTGKPIAQLVANDTPFATDAQAVAGMSEWMGYGLPTVYVPDAPMIVPQAAPVLLESRFPELTWEQRAEVLRRTAAPAGNPLDWQAEGGSWQRINLVAATAAQVTVNPDGSLTIN
ncbi:acid phosphatase [Corynebacterium auris]|uniref:acid phosphatase n=1 Tax=Corynebacterium auris TaxID=44750 RepID=UPI0025B30783|nr:phosphatase PAP2 family protein [Corynebacterium auris]WJY68575.1 Major phosphate-irrepressible acid phosphatase precursor [Corynebacterium auris]